MQKPADLRDYLIAQFPQLGKKPDNLQMFIESGAVRARINNRNFQINYQLQVIFLNWTSHNVIAMIALNDWISRNEPDLIARHGADAFSFQADFIDSKAVDLQFTLQLTEQVQLARNEDDDGDEITFLAAPDVAEMLEGPALSDPPANLGTIFWGDEPLIPHPEDR
ncbi:MAG: phage tail protein [Parasphingorhabdus sp.]|nr:phage tail protein [Parasphingorhabdus sp.]